MTSVSGSRLVLYVSGLKSLLHRVTSSRNVSASAFTASRTVRSVWCRDSAPCRAPEPLLVLTPMDCHLQALTTTHTATAPPTDQDMRTHTATAPPTDQDMPTQEHKFFSSVWVECAVQPCPPRLLSDVRLMFPEAPPAGVTVVTVTQRSQQDMSRWDLQVEQEREELLRRFIEGASQICSELQREGHWADFIDPSSGLPFFGPYTNMTLFETDDRYSALGFSVDDLGCCRVLRHSLWGSNVFVGSVFTVAPPEDSRVMQVLQGRGI
ncbi:cobalamin trafficking protein CblD-like isoform X2 [Eucyclogobius newberryi]|uniref:cobalamin trafficking protein CblD-like isoform X2 n=1 Tax=Eucyclogobius newberryi TaxID=166745 RepID=UPI003B5C8466